MEKAIKSISFAFFQRKKAPSGAFHCFENRSMTFDQVRNGFIQEECDRTIDTCFQCIEGDDRRDHHAHYHFQRSTHKQGCKDHIHHDHCQSLGDRTADQRKNRCFLGNTAKCENGAKTHEKPLKMPQNRRSARLFIIF